MTSNNEKDFSLRKTNNIEDEPKFFERIFDYFSRENVIVKAVFIVGILSIVLGVAGMYFRIRNSFASSQIVLEDRASVIENLNRTKDTDGDGLSDYDELMFYNTSPYLEDSDLDGVSDYDEIILGKDGIKTVTAIGNPPTDESAFLKAMSEMDYQNMTLEQFKNSLLQMGYDANSVNAITQEDFNEIKQTLPNTPSGNSSNSNLTQDELNQIEKMKNLSIPEIKELMIQGGATKEELDKFSDEDLKQLYLQTLDEISSSQQ